MDLPWIEKYRPSNLDQIIDHQDKIETLKNLISRGELTHMLFYGPPGCGKTSTILACAQALYGDKYRRYILELNASDDRGIDVVRNKIPEFIKTYCAKIRLIILDEADALTTEAQNALRQVIEKHSNTSRFCLICNNKTKIIPGLQSRCTTFLFRYLSPDKIKERLDQIIQAEDVQIDPSALNRLIGLDKDFRQILNTLQCLHALNRGQSTITTDQINRYLGIPTDDQINQIIQILTDLSVVEACNQMYQLYRDHQWDLADLIHHLARYVIRENFHPIDILPQLSQLEVRISQSNDAEIQLYSLVAVFQKLKDI